MDLSKGEGEFSTINVTPLVDVMLVLLIVFMVTAPMLGTDVQVDLARADVPGAAGAAAEPPVAVTVAADGRVWVGDTPSHDTEALVRAALEGTRDQAIALRADGRCRYQDVTDAIAAARRGGATAVELVFDPVMPGG